MINVLKSFSYAKTDCRSRGGYLATPTTAAENAMIADVITTNGTLTYWLDGDVEVGSSDPYWINIQLDKNNQPTKVLPFTNYYGTEPNDSLKKCVGILSAKNFKWGDRGCSYELPYVCAFYSKCEIFESIMVPYCLIELRAF